MGRKVHGDCTDFLDLPKQEGKGGQGGAREGTGVTHLILISRASWQTAQDEQQKWTRQSPLQYRNRGKDGAH